MKKLIATFLLVVTIMIAGVVVAQVYNTLHGTVNLTVTAVDPLYIIGSDTWDLTLNPGESEFFLVEIGNYSEADVTVHISLADTPLGIYIDAADWVIGAKNSLTFPVTIGVEYPAEGNYILDVVFEPL